MPDHPQGASPPPSLQAVAEEKESQLRERFPHLSTCCSNTSGYTWPTEEEAGKEQEVLEAMAGGRLEEQQVVALRQAEEGLSQANMFTRLLPAPGSSRWAGRCWG